MTRFRFCVAVGFATLVAVPAGAEAPPPARPHALGPSGQPQTQLEPTDGLCGALALRGERLPSIAGEGGCGIDVPVRLESAAGVALEPSAVVACETAHALIAWLQGGAIAVLADKGAKLQALVVADAYSCRNRNRASKGKLSEHALGHAIDIGAFHLRDGRIVTVNEGWRSPEWGATLRRLRDAACRPFGTVLGPGSNPLHTDHLHFDWRRGVSGPGAMTEVGCRTDGALLGAAALRRAGKGGAPLRAIIARNADRHARDLAPVVEDVRASGHTSLRAMAEELNARGMLTRGGGRRRVSTVTNLLERLGLR